MDKVNDGEKLLLSVRETMTLTGLSRNAVYAACHNGQLPTLKVGKRLWVSRPALLKMLENSRFNPTISVNS
jgi:hypothetical protein